MKGNDHQCSLDIDEFTEMVKSIRTMEVALGGPMKRFEKCEEECFKKLGKCLLANKELKKGNTITEQDLCIKVSFSIPIFPTVSLQLLLIQFSSIFGLPFLFTFRLHPINMVHGGHKISTRLLEKYAKKIFQKMSLLWLSILQSDKVISKFTEHRTV